MKDLKQHPSTMDPDMLREHGMEVLDIIAAEFASDPQSLHEAIARAEARWNAPDPEPATAECSDDEIPS